MRSRWIVAAAAAPAVAAVAARATPRSTIAPRTRVALRKLALRSAADSGERHPRDAARRRDDFQEGARDHVRLQERAARAGRRGVVIAMRGRFNARVPTPFGVPEPTGSVLSLVVDARTLKTYEVGVGNRYPGFASVGRPVRLGG